ncbi:MAG TPA: carbon-nitrogen hydrolase family protein [Gemmatimonadaceae bacterium]|nr:carbon-nitrogen hydrolase family protein [Gemmatimonadaceae bacterium]
MKVAAYQAPLACCATPEAIALIREQIDQCESVGVEILCCPEAILGGLADYSDQPASIASIASIAFNVGGDQLHTVLAPLASNTVTTILGFTETTGDGRLFNAAAVFHRASIVGVYRKLHPAINRSVYDAGHEMPVFTVGALTFGVLICRDSTFSEPARVMASRGAAALFVPTNNGMPSRKGGPELVDEARSGDVALAIECGVSVIRADVVGRTRDLVSYGSSGIVDQDGEVLGIARPLESGLVIADISVARRGPPALRTDT